MLGFILLSIFIIIVGSIIFFEIRNEKRYQEKRARERQKDFKKKDTTSPTPKSISPTRVPLEKKEVIAAPEVISVPNEEIKLDKPVVKKELPQANYPNFSHQRLIDMGLSDDEAKEFVQELIPQLESQIPLIEEVLNIPDFHQMERLTHSIKGSATNIGSGGVSDLLIACNTYFKTGTDVDIATAYFEQLKHYTQELKLQYT